MAFIDYYKILGVSKDIPQKDVRAAYKKRAKQFHPDLHPNDPKAKAKFQALNEAYDVIGDPEKRKKYDQYGEHWKEADAFGGAGGGGFKWGSGGDGSPFDGFDFSSFSTGGSGFSSFFEELFGRGTRSRSTRQTASQTGGDMTAVVNIDLRTALLGGDVVIQLANGTKLKLKVKPETQSGTKVKLRGKGYQRSDGSFGDMIITYNVKLPTNLTERQKELIRQL
ncbi:MAG: DnaJ domain-containing protein [Prevotella sp.]|nr:DnaJ domain-containing protein [Prevotella sp.]